MPDASRRSARTRSRRQPEPRPAARGRGQPARGRPDAPEGASRPRCCTIRSCSASFRPPDPASPSVAVSPDRSRSRVSGSDGTVQLWNAARATADRPTPAERAGKASAVAFSRAGKQLVTANHDGTVSAFDVATGGRRLATRVRADPGASQSVPTTRSVAVSSTIGYEWTGDRCSSRRRRDRGRRRSTRSRPVNGVAFSPDGRLLVAGRRCHRPRRPGGRRDRLGRRQVERGPPSSGATRNGVSAVAFSPDGRSSPVRALTRPRSCWDTAHTHCGRPAAARRPHLRQSPALGGVQPRRPAVGNRGRQGLDLGPRAASCRRGSRSTRGGGGAVLSLGFGSAGRLAGRGDRRRYRGRLGHRGHAGAGQLVPGVGTDGGVLSGDGRFVAAVGTGPVPAVGVPADDHPRRQRNPPARSGTLGKAGHDRVHGRW